LIKRKEIEYRKVNETAIKSEHEAKNSILDQSNDHLLRQNNNNSINKKKHYNRNLNSIKISSNEFMLNEKKNQ